MSNDHLFAASVYQLRREKLMESVGSGLILLLGNEESGKNYKDNTYAFRQDSRFLYFLGLDAPGMAAVIDADQRHTTLFADDLSLDHIVWMGPQPSVAERAARVGVEKTAPYGKLEALLKAAADAGRKIHFLPPYRPENMIKLRQWLGIPVEGLASAASVALIRAVINQAAYKSNAEVAEIEKAVTVSGEMHKAAMRLAQAGMKEAQLAGIITGIAIGSGGDLAYPAIITVNGQTLHNHYYGNTLQSGQLVLGDFGTETAMHYAGDITRTFPVDETFTNQQKEIYQLVLDTEIAAIQAVKPGVRYLDIHLQAARRITNGLKELGLMQGDTEEAVAAGAHALFFPHGLGHMLGLDVHDMEDLGEEYVGYTETLLRSDQFGLKSLRLARALEPGFVLTVEPGIYFIPELIDRWGAEKRHNAFIAYDKLEAYRNFSGIRIEDNVLVTEAGAKVLGEPIPKTIAEVEGMRMGRPKAKG